MIPDRFSETDFLELLTRANDGLASTDELGRLNTWIQNVPRARRLYLSLMNQQSGIATHFAAEQQAGREPVGLIDYAKLVAAAPRSPLATTIASTSSRPPATDSWRWVSALGRAIDRDLHPVRFYAIVSVLTLAFLSVLGLLIYPRGDGGAVATGRHSNQRGGLVFVAQVIGSHRAVEVQGSAPTFVGANLQPGQTIHLSSGLAEIEFKSGARVILDGPVEFRLDDRNVGRLNRGRLVAHVPRQAVGFQVHAPDAVVTDLSTEFGIEVSGNGLSRVTVLVGKVELRSLTTGDVRVLTVGQMARTDFQGTFHVDQGIAESQFTRLMPLRRRTLIDVFRPGILIVSDPIDDDGTWQLSGNAFFDSTGLGFLRPCAQTMAASVAMVSRANDGARKVFPEVVLSPGTYTVTFAMGNYSNTKFPPALSAELVTADGTRLDDLLVSSTTPSPPRGGWIEWILVYEVPRGDPRIGAAIGFSVEDHGGGNGAFDSLQIWYAPRDEPSAPVDATADRGAANVRLAKKQQPAL